MTTQCFAQVTPITNVSAKDFNLFEDVTFNPDKMSEDEKSLYYSAIELEVENFAKECNDPYEVEIF